MMYDVRLIHGADTDQWSYYFLRQLKHESTDLKVLQQKDSDLIGSRSSCSTRSSSNTDSAFSVSSMTEVESSAVVVIVSPLHLSFLHQNPDFRYDAIVSYGGLFQLFLCGIEPDAFEELDSNGLEIRQRFPNFHEWKQVTVGDSAQIVSNIKAFLKVTTTCPPATQRMRSMNGSRKRRKVKFTIKPNQIKSNSSTLLTILFERELTQRSTGNERNDLEVIFDENRGCQRKTFRANAVRCNPYTYQFTAPPHPIGEVRVKVILDDLELGSTWLTYMPPSSLEIDTVGMLIEMFVQLIAELIAFLDQLGILTGDIDQRLANIIADNHSASDNLFSCLRSMQYDPSQFKYPTLLHVAARYGLEELCRRLIELPEVRFAMLMASSENRTPEELAKEHNHYNVTQIIQEHEIDDNIDDDYVPIDRQVSRIGESDATDISEDDETDDGSGYMDMDHVMKELASIKASTNVETTESEIQSSFPKSETDCGTSSNTCSSQTIHSLDNAQADENCEQISKSAADDDDSLPLKETPVELLSQEPSPPSPSLSSFPSSTLNTDCCPQSRPPEAEHDIPPPQSRPDTPKRTQDSLDLSDQTVIREQPTKATLPHDQKELISILRQMAAHEMSFNEGELLIKELELRQKNEAAKKQEDLQKIRDQISLTEKKKQTKKSYLWPFLGRRPSDLADKATSKATFQRSYARQISQSDQAETANQKNSDTQFSRSAINVGQNTKRYSKKIEQGVANSKATEESSVALLETTDPVSEQSSRESFRSVNSFTSNSSGADLEIVEELPPTPVIRKAMKASKKTSDGKFANIIDTVKSATVRKDTLGRVEEQPDEGRRRSRSLSNIGKVPVGTQSKETKKPFWWHFKSSASSSSKKQSNSAEQCSSPLPSTEEHRGRMLFSRAKKNRSQSPFLLSAKTSPMADKQAAEVKEPWKEVVQQQFDKKQSHVSRTKDHPVGKNGPSPTLNAQEADDVMGSKPSGQETFLNLKQIATDLVSSKKPENAETVSTKINLEEQKMRCQIECDIKIAKEPAVGESLASEELTNRRQVFKHSKSQPILLSFEGKNNDTPRCLLGVKSAEGSNVRPMEDLTSSSLLGTAGQTTGSVRDIESKHAEPVQRTRVNANTSGQSEKILEFPSSADNVDSSFAKEEAKSSQEIISHSENRSQQPSEESSRREVPVGVRVSTLSGHPEVKLSNESDQMIIESCNMFRLERKEFEPDRVVHPPFPTLSSNASENSKSKPATSLEMLQTSESTETIPAKSVVASDEHEFCISHQNPSSYEVTEVHIPLKIEVNVAASIKDAEIQTTDKFSSAKLSKIENIESDHILKAKETDTQNNYIGKEMTGLHDGEDVPGKDTYMPLERNLVLAKVCSDIDTNTTSSQIFPSQEALKTQRQYECNDSANQTNHEANSKHAKDERIESQKSSLQGNEAERVECRQMNANQKEKTVTKDEIIQIQNESNQDSGNKNECIENVNVITCNTINETKLNVPDDSIKQESDTEMAEIVQRLEEPQTNSDKEEQTGYLKPDNEVSLITDQGVVDFDKSDDDLHGEFSSIGPPTSSVSAIGLTAFSSSIESSNPIHGVSTSTQRDYIKTKCKTLVYDRSLGPRNTVDDETTEPEFSENDTTKDRNLAALNKQIEVLNLEDSRGFLETNESRNNEDKRDSSDESLKQEDSKFSTSDGVKMDTNQTSTVQQILEIEHGNVDDGSKSFSLPPETRTTESRRPKSQRLESECFSRQSLTSDSLPNNFELMEHEQTPRSANEMQLNIPKSNHPDAAIETELVRTHKRTKSQSFGRHVIEAFSLSDKEKYSNYHSMSAPGSPRRQRKSSPSRPLQTRRLSVASIFPNSGSTNLESVRGHLEETDIDEVFHFSETSETNTKKTSRYSEMRSSDESGYCFDMQTHGMCGNYQDSKAIITTENSLHPVDTKDSEIENKSESASESNCEMRIIHSAYKPNRFQDDFRHENSAAIVSRNSTPGEQTAAAILVQMRQHTGSKRPPLASTGSKVSDRTDQGTPTRSCRNSFPCISSLPFKLQQHLQRQVSQETKRHTIAFQPFACQHSPLPIDDNSMVSSDPELSAPNKPTPSSLSLQFMRSKHPPTTLPKPKRRVRPLSAPANAPSSRPSVHTKRHSTSYHGMNDQLDLGRLDKSKTRKSAVVAGKNETSSIDIQKNLVEKTRSELTPKIDRRRQKTPEDNAERIINSDADDSHKAFGNRFLHDVSGMEGSSSKKHHLTPRPAEINAAGGAFQLRFQQPRPHSVCSPISEEYQGLVQSSEDCRPQMAVKPSPVTNRGLPSQMKLHRRSQSLSLYAQEKRYEAEGRSKGCDKKAA